MGKVRPAVVTVLAAIAALASACGANGSGGEGGGGVAAPPAARSNRVTGAGASVESITRAHVVGGVPALEPKVVKHGVLVVEVPKGSFDEAMDRASVTAGRYGGFVETSSTQGVKVRSGTLVIRVPSDRFERAVHDLRALGQVRGQTISGRDVTSRIVDLQARLRNLKTQEAVLRRLLAKAPTVKATLNVQRVLSDVQLGIEELTGQLDALGNQVDLSTIRLEISEPGATPITAQGVEKPKLRVAFDTAVAAFLAVIYGLTVGIGALIPVLLLAGIAFLAFRMIRERRRAAAAA
jgi:hypothetical protein